MNEKKNDEIEQDLKELCVKHGIAGVSFTGHLVEEDTYVGLFSIDNQKVSGCMEAALNVGRLWQHVRQTMKSALDIFEKKW